MAHGCKPSTLLGVLLHDKPVAVQDLHSVCGDVAWLEWALELQEVQDALFWDSAAGDCLARACPAILPSMAAAPLWQCSQAHASC